MPDYTNNLNLTKVNTTTDGNNTFNMDTYLNSNWDKLDAEAGKTITTDKLINNASATIAGFALDSRMGKTFGDAINTINTNISNVTTTANNAYNDINNLQVGGRNLLLQSNIEQGNLEGTNGTTITGASNFFRTINAISVTQSDSLCLRINKVSGTNCQIEKIIAYNSSGYLGTYTQHLTNVNFIVPTSCTSIKITFIIDNGVANTLTKDFQIKLEKGTKPTDWTPAPEDIDSQLTENMQNIAQLSNPNLLINGDFQVWQRDTSFTAPSGNTYLADRWNFSTYGSDVDPNTHCVVNKVDDGLSLVCTGATGTGNTIWRQPFESDTVKKLLGKIVTLSFSIKTSNIGQISAGFNVTSVDGFENPVNLKSSIGTSSDYVQYNVTFTIPKTASVFMPQILLKVPSGTSSYILKDVKLELGSMPTPFSPRPYAEELAMCQRYYENNFTVGGNGVVDPNGNVAVYIPYKVTKRISPIVTVDSNLLSNCLSQVGYTPRTPTSIGLSDRNINGNLIFFGGLTSIVGYNITIANNGGLKNLITANAEIIL